MSGPVKIMALLVARQGKVDELSKLLLGMADPSRSEPGNLLWNIWKDQADPGRFVLDELYKDNAAVAAHRETPHYRTYFAAIGDLAERTAVVLDPVHVA